MVAETVGARGGRGRPGGVASAFVTDPRRAGTVGRSDPPDFVRRFLDCHRPGQPLLMPNPWDVGSARLLEALGFGALATTSSGFAASMARLDNDVTRDEAIDHAALLAAAVGVPVSADLENGFGDTPEEVAETVRRAIDAGLAGCSIEDGTGNPDDPLYDIGLATERIRAAVEAATGADGSPCIVLTARAENFVVGRRDLGDAIARVERYADAGAHVLFTPGTRKAEDISAVVAATELPVSVLALPGAPTVSELAELGVARISVGGAFAYAAYGALVRAANELAEHGSYGYWDDTGAGREVIQKHFAGEAGHTTVRGSASNVRMPSVRTT